MPEVPVEELPMPLREVKEKYPEAKLYETTPESHGLKSCFEDFCSFGPPALYRGRSLS